MKLLTPQPWERILTVGLKQPVSEVLPAALWQRCYVHFLRNALDYLPRQADDDCRQEMRWMYERRDAEEAWRDLKAWLEKWGGKYPKLCAWVEANIEETWTFYRLPREHHKHPKSTNVCSGSTRNSSGGRWWCGSFRARRAASGWCGRRLRTGTALFVPCDGIFSVNTNKNPATIAAQNRTP